MHKNCIVCGDPLENKNTLTGRAYESPALIKKQYHSGICAYLLVKGSWGGGVFRIGENNLSILRNIIALHEINDFFTNLLK